MAGVSPILGGLLGASAGIGAMLRGQISGLKAKQEKRRADSDAKMKDAQLKFELMRLRQQREISLDELRQRRDELGQRKSEAEDVRAVNDEKNRLTEQAQFLDFYGDLNKSASGTGTGKGFTGDLTDVQFQKAFGDKIDSRFQDLMSDDKFGEPADKGGRRFRPEFKHYGKALDVFKDPESRASAGRGFRDYQEIKKSYPKAADRMLEWDQSQSAAETLEMLEVLNSGEDVDDKTGKAGLERFGFDKSSIQLMMSRYRALAREEKRKLGVFQGLNIPGFTAGGELFNKGAASGKGLSDPRGIGE